MTQSKGFIFDLDGVLVDTAKYHFLAWKKLADELGIPFTQEDNEQFKGVSRKRCLEILLQMGNLTVDQEQFNTYMEEKNQDYLAYIDAMDSSEILPDVTRVLDHLKQKKAPLAVGSASKNAVAILEKVGLMPYFDAVVDGTVVTRAKPDPEVFTVAAQQLGVPANGCTVFEDAVAGIAAANAANMTSIGLGDASVLAQADHVFKDFTEVSNGFLDSLMA